MMTDLHLLQDAAFVLAHGGYEVEAMQVRAAVAEIEAARCRESPNRANLRDELREILARWFFERDQRLSANVTPTVSRGVGYGAADALMSGPLASLLAELGRIPLIPNDD